jgi:hypothetical protein
MDVNQIAHERLLALTLAGSFVASPVVYAERVAWGFWEGKTAASMVLEHSYVMTLDNAQPVPMVAQCDDLTRECVSQDFAFSAGDHVLTISAYWNAIQSWSKPSEPVAFTIDGEPPPPPPPPPPPTSTCVTDGVVYESGGTLGPITLAQKSVDPYIAARIAEGWIVLSRTKTKNQATLTFQCP